MGCGVRDMSLYRAALTAATALPDSNMWRHLSCERLEYLG